MPDLKVFEASNTCLLKSFRKTNIKKTLFKDMKSLDECKVPDLSNRGWGVELDN